MSAWRLRSSGNPDLVATSPIQSIIPYPFKREEKMRTAKEEVRRMLDQIPDDATFEDIQYHIYVREKIERGLKDIQEGHLLSQEEAEQRMSKWLGK
jgi:predicted transcriptional regulator